METKFKRIIVGVDGSDTADAALQWAVDEARARGGVVEAVYAWDPPMFGAPPPSYVWNLEDFETQAREILDKTVGSVNADGLEKSIERILVRGDAAKVLTETAKGADLLVVGNRGRGSFSSLLLGSVSQKVVNQAECPVLIYRQTS